MCWGKTQNVHQEVVAEPGLGNPGLEHGQFMAIHQYVESYHALTCEMYSTLYRENPSTTKPQEMPIIFVLTSIGKSSNIPLAFFSSQFKLHYRVSILVDWKCP